MDSGHHDEEESNESLYDFNRVPSRIELCPALDDMGLSSGQRRYSGSTPRWYSQEHPCIGQRPRYITSKIGWISVTYANKTRIEQKSSSWAQDHATARRHHALSADSSSLPTILSLSNLSITFFVSWSQSTQTAIRPPMTPVDTKAIVIPIQRPQSFISCLKAR